MGGHFVAVVLAAAGSLGQVGRQVSAAQDRLHVVGQQQPLRPTRCGVEVHHPALKALVDEIRVVGVAARTRDWRAPDFEVDQRIVGAGNRCRNQPKERFAEGNCQAFEAVWRSGSGLNAAW